MHPKMHAYLEHLISYVKQGENILTGCMVLGGPILGLLYYIVSHSNLPFHTLHAPLGVHQKHP